MADFLDLFSRRRWLRAAAPLVAALASARAQVGNSLVIPGKRPLLVHNDFPEDAETPLAHFRIWLTPNDVFFLRQHLPRPEVDTSAWRLQVTGKVTRELRLSLDELRKLPRHTVPATLECTGNGRGFFRPRVSGIQWGRGAIGNAEWSGPRLSDVLKLAGADLRAPMVEFDGADRGVAATPDFIRSMPTSKGLHPATLLALDMNGQPMPELHGAPCRLIVPGWDGTSWVKWLVRISVTERPHDGFYMNPAYRIPKYPVPPGASAPPSSLEVIEGMPVKSIIAAPLEDARLPFGPVRVSGVAWAGEQAVEQVEVSVDGGSRWSNATLSSPKLPFAWRLWEFEWKPAERGYYTVMSRARDSAGRVQPIQPSWNPSGYLWNGIDRVGVTVGERG